MSASILSRRPGRGDGVPLALLLLSLTLGACGGSTSVVTRITAPPPVQALRGDSPKVLIPSIQGARGSRATQRLMRNISTPSYFAFTKHQPDAEFIIAGRLSPDDFKRDVERVESKKCVQRNAKKECTRMQPVTNYTLSESCRVALTLTVTQVSTGRVVFSGSADAQKGPSFFATMRDQPPAASDTEREELCNEALIKVVDELSEKIAARTEEVKLRFYSGFEAPRGKKVTAEMVSLVDSRKLKAADAKVQSLFAEKSLTAEERDWSRYNHAVLLFGMGRFGECASAVEELPSTLRSESKVRDLGEKCGEYR